MDVRMKLLLPVGLIPILLFTQSMIVQAQCPITVSAGQDKVVCNAGGTITLDGSISGNALDFSWSPSTGLSDPNDLTPIATVTGPMTYTLTAQAIDPSVANLVTNGAFEGGNTGFTSSYTYNPVPITPGTYFLTTSPSLVLSNFPPCDDHTYGNGTGYMMLVNGAGVPGANIWCQTIPVTPNTYYVMSAWVAGSPLFPPQLQFNVNGSPVGNVFNSSGSGCVWEQFSATWFSGAAGSATLCIVTQNSGNGLFGDDYVLDDISFAAACTVSDEVAVSVATVDAVLPTTAILPCNAAQTGIVLDGTASTAGPGISYQWTTLDGNILSGANTPSATVNAEGSYTLTVTFSNGIAMCEDAATITVLPDPNIVFASVAAPAGINCIEPVITLDGSGSSAGPGISYAWEYMPAPGGVPPGIVAGGNTQFPDVNQPGTYTLTVTHTPSGCTASDFAIVSADVALPTAMASAPGNLSCSISTLTLSGNGSSTGSNFSYLWETTNGNILSGANTLNNAVVDAPGAYVLTVINTQNGCTASSLVGISGSSGTPPTAMASAPTIIDCNNPSVQLDGTGSSGGNNTVYQWTTATGIIDSGAMTLMPWVSAATVYVLTVTDTLSGCSDTASTAVTANLTSPTIDISLPDTLTCTTTSIFLDGTNSSSGAQFSSLWTTMDGLILNGETTLTPAVGEPGTYTLTVTNDLTGCTASLAANVLHDGNLPVANLSTNGQLNCIADTLLLDGSASSAGAGIVFSWATTDGHFAAGENTLTPSVDSPGTYTLTIVDQNNNCSSSASIMLLQDTVPPVANAGLDGTMTCTASTLLLDGSMSDQDSIFQYQWTTPNGQIISGDTTLAPEVGQAGLYILTITNQENGCTASDAVLINLDTVPPLSEAGPPAMLTCDMPTVILDGSASSQSTDMVYQWTFTPPIGGGTVGIISGESTLNPEVGENGFYFLTVTDTTNGCTAIDSVTVSLFADFPNVLISPANPLTCTMSTTILSATASSGSNFSYLWTTQDGNILSGETTLSPTVDAPGAYLLTVTNNFNGCTAADVVLVGQDSLVPLADAGNPFQLSCSMTSAQLDGTASSTGNGITYFWTTVNGNISGGINSLTPTINAAGTYVLTITNQLNGCTAQDQVTISQDANAPVSNAGNAQYITCTMNQVMLNGSNSSAGPNISYNWTTQDGNILSGATTPTPLVNAPGTYLLMVTNTMNSCQTLSSVMVIDYTQSPNINAGTGTELTCSDTLYTLSGTASGGSSLAFLWTTQDGNIVSGENTLQPDINAPGIYSLTGTNQQNGCSATASVTITQDTVSPTLQLEDPPSLTCNTQQISLNATGSSAGPNFSYEWVTLDGNILTGANLSNPIVDEPGTYFLTVTNQQNGCFASGFLTVAQDTAAPLAIVSPPDTLDCSTSQITLDGTGSSTGPAFSYAWTNVDGNIVGGETTLQPLVDGPGTYQLMVVNQDNGCSATVSATVLTDGSKPVVQILPPGELNCISQQITLDASASSGGSGYFIEWTTLNGHFLDGDTSLLPIVDSPGTYILSITNLQNGCLGIDSVILTDNIAIPTADAGLPMTLTCQEDVAALSGHSPDAGVQFLWTTTNGHFLFGQTTTMPAVDAPGMYYLMVTNPVNGCSATDSVEVNAFKLEGFSFEKLDPGCATGTGSIYFTSVQGGLPPYQFSVDGRATFTVDTFFANLPPGTYELVVKDDGGCKLVQQTALAGLYEIIIQLDPQLDILLGESLQLKPVLNIPTVDVVQVLWTPSDYLDCSDCLSPTITGVFDETYLLEITDANGCTASASTIVKVAPDNSIYVPNAFSPNGDGINDLFMIFSKGGLVKAVVSFQVFTRWGESVFAYRNFPPGNSGFGWDGTHKGKKLGVGVYAWWAEIELINGERKLLEGEVLLLK